MRVRGVLGGLLALTAALALSAGAVSGLPSTPSFPSFSPDGVAPGPYSGPGDEAVPESWHPWTSKAHAQCGKLKLVFRNPDLQEDADGVVHASGTFFIQFQAVGPGAADVTRFSFSFGATTKEVNDNANLNCNTAIPDGPLGRGTGGAYLVYYRSDFNPKDGFFVPIRTFNVPDGEYAAAVHAYTGNCGPGEVAGCVEVARTWTRAIVKNCNGPSYPTGDYCLVGDTPESIRANDKIVPWPMILPGDGQQTNDVKGLTVEFAEPMINDTVKVWVNGNQVSLEKWDPPLRDDDLQPNNDDQPCPANHELRYVCTRALYGPGFKWLGDVLPNDVIRVEGRDKARNLLVKTVHYGVGTSAGAVDIEKPDVDMAAVNGDTVEIKPGSFHEFNVRLTNLGASDAHVNLAANYTEAKGLLASWVTLDGALTQHEVVPAGKGIEVKFKVDSDPAMKPQLFKIQGLVGYDVQGEPVTKKLLFTVSVHPSADDGHTHLHNAGLEPTAAVKAPDEGAVPLATESAQGLPGAGLAAGILALALAVVSLGRRRLT